MKYVYILQSLTNTEHFYTGITDDLDARLLKHNSGAVTHAATYRPWRIKSYVAFSDRDGARCRLCGALPRDGVRLHVDHVKPWGKGGETVLENLQILCNVCNIGKSDVELGN